MSLGENIIIFPHCDAFYNILQIVMDHAKKVLWASNAQCVPLRDNSCEVL